MGMKRRPSRRRPTLLEELIHRDVASTMEGTISIAVQKLAEEFARETMADPAFREAIRAMAREAGAAILAELRA